MDRKSRVRIEIDGVSYTAPLGVMLIEVADAHGINIPRFCYHKHLSIAANCRMCLVEVEQTPKPLPACATPVHDGMKVLTRSPMALTAQKGVMEFLLINHPLDCPVCDQGGECELQDISIGFGEGVSRYTEAKRVVPDPDIGPLIATNMTRCIHCTRCVRFIDEVAGVGDLGATGRGENMRIGTFIKHAMESELAGNIIDLCPVGALTDKPFRFTARAWEMIQHRGVAAHDCVGSNLYAHSYRNRIVRVVPRENESINETWISDRDRFSCVAAGAEDRLLKPMLKDKGQWREAEWDEALVQAAQYLRAGDARNTGALISPNATLEEHYLFQKLLRAMGVLSIDHRLHQLDFSGQAVDPLFFWLGQSIDELENSDVVLLVGSNIRKDQPILGMRLRKAAITGSKVADINPQAFDFTYPLAARMIVSPGEILFSLRDILAAVCAAQDKSLPGWLEKAGEPSTQAKAIASLLLNAKRGSILLGPLSINHPAFAKLRILAGELAARTGIRFGYLPEGANSAGACLAGTLPHRGAAGRKQETGGLDARAMFAKPRSTYILYGVEPEWDCADPAMALAALGQAKQVVLCTSFVSERAKQYADVILPLALPMEASGTLVNTEGRWQSFKGMVPPPGEVRPGWKVLRVLGNMLDLGGFEQLSSEEVREELKSRMDLTQRFDNSVHAESDFALSEAISSEEIIRTGGHSIYAIDAQVRRSTPLQATSDAAVAGVWLNQHERTRLLLGHVEEVFVEQDGHTVRLPLGVNDALANGVAWIPSGIAGLEGLGVSTGPIRLRPAPAGVEV